ncbi:MAG TPA: phosphoglycerate dehydrogenase [Desulfosalsimonadaceae bacterium]|nr:phosphoglycerate dehydrogenase [Desulfosalsimonadaceae bacterium]
MKVLISDNLGQAGIDIFENESGIDVDVKTGLPPDELQSIIPAYDALVIRSATKVTEDLLNSAKNLKVVGRAGIGLDNVDIPAATKKGVMVMNTPGGNVVTTAEHTIALMMSLTRNIPQGTASLKAGRWDKKKLQGREIMNKAIGVIGYGKIGSVAADRARGLKMRVMIYDPVISPETIEKKGFEAVTLDTLYQEADYITVHVPKSKNTLGMIDAAAFEKMKSGVMLINCARGGIVDEAALKDALESGKVAGAALDVFETEPLPADHPLLGFDNVVLTPHLGASTIEAQTNVAVAVAQQIIEYLKNNNIINAVNVPSIPGKLLDKLQPYLYLADRMGCLVAQFTSGQLKEVRVEYNGDFQDLDMSPVTTGFVKGLLDPMVPDEVNSINAPMLAKEKGIKVSETSTAESQEFTNLISAEVVTTAETYRVAGTVFGKSDSRIVRFNDFRIEIVPQGHLALIHNMDEPGAIGSIGNTLGENGINISRMQVGREASGENNIILIRTDTPINASVIEKIQALPKVKNIRAFEL